MRRLSAYNVLLTFVNCAACDVADKEAGEKLFCSELRVLLRVGGALASNETRLAFDWERNVRMRVQWLLGVHCVQSHRSNSANRNRTRAQCGLREHENVCGRPLGLRVDPTQAHTLLVADAYYGILRIHVIERTVRVLANADMNKRRRFRFTNDLAIDKQNRRALFSVSSTRFERRSVFYEVLESSCTGSLYALHLDTLEMHELIDK